MKALESFMQMLRDSAIMRQQVYQLVLAVLTLVGAQVDLAFLEENGEAVVDGVLRALSGVIALYTMFTRAVKPAPNLTAAADQKEAELVESGKLPVEKATVKAVASVGSPSKVETAVTKLQGGYARVSFLLAFLVALGACSGVLVLTGCASTLAAYETADTLEEEAYVLTEHFAALVHEAADLKGRQGLTDATKDALRNAANASARYVVGDPTTDPPLPGLDDLARTYQDVRSAENREALQLALDRAVVEVATFLRELRKAQQSPAGSLPSRSTYADGLLARAGGE